MSNPLHDYGGTGPWSQAAAGIVVFVGAYAIVGGLRGGVTLTPTQSYLGAAALAVLAASVGRDAVASVRLEEDNGGADRALGDDGRPVLELYQAEGCPHCSKVRTFCTRRGISLVVHNPRTVGLPFTSGTVTNRARYEELVDHGQDQVPLLVDNARDVSLYESDDIVVYLEEYYGQ